MKVFSKIFVPYFAFCICNWNDSNIRFFFLLYKENFNEIYRYISTLGLSKKWRGSSCAFKTGAVATTENINGAGSVLCGFIDWPNRLSYIQIYS
jgi:hypothetical protein